MLHLSIALLLQESEQAVVSMSTVSAAVAKDREMKRTAEGMLSTGVRGGTGQATAEKTTAPKTKKPKKKRAKHQEALQSAAPVHAQQKDVSQVIRLQSILRLHHLLSMLEVRVPSHS